MTSSAAIVFLSAVSLFAVSTINASENTLNAFEQTRSSEKSGDMAITCVQRSYAAPSTAVRRVVSEMVDGEEGGRIVKPKFAPFEFWSNSSKS